MVSDRDLPPSVCHGDPNPSSEVSHQPFFGIGERRLDFGRSASNPRGRSPDCELGGAHGEALSKDPPGHPELGLNSGQG
jgi:hypothetical protein